MFILYLLFMTNDNINTIKNSYYYHQIDLIFLHT